LTKLLLKKVTTTEMCNLKDQTRDYAVEIGPHDWSAVVITRSGSAEDYGIFTFYLSTLRNRDRERIGAYFSLFL